MGKKFMELVEESVIFQGILVIMIGFTVCSLYYRGMPVPEGLDRLVFMIAGFFFGGKGVTAVGKVRSLQAKAAGAEQ